jgi:predicted HicB family RNase H-like nuclease
MIAKKQIDNRTTDAEGRVTFRIDPELRKRLDLLAEQDGRSLSSYIHRVLAAHIRDIDPLPDNKRRSR